MTVLRVQGPDPCDNCDRRARELAAALVDKTDELIHTRRVIADAHDLLERGQWQSARSVISAAIQTREAS